MKEDIITLVKYLDSILDNDFDRTGEYDEEGDKLVKEMKRKYKIA